ncbi:DUF3413 domain-containing protein [Celerinatantimonas sp. YJH-8]|uniref:DUF3413 domain-containing protein n=1 Tax=Celerinatantimonas sp. YJH-8 TaxID=3228714 RepID=UPI0038CA867E
MKNIKNKLTTLGLFALLNALIAILIAIRYFQYLPALPNDITGLTFLVSSLIGQMSLLAGVVALAGIPFMLLPFKIGRWIIALLATLAITALLIDTFVFAQYRFHINAVVLELVMSGDIVTFALATWLKALFSFILIFLFEVWLTGIAANQFKKMKFKLGRTFCGLVIICLLASNGIHAWGSAYANQSVLMTDRYLPLFYPLSANALMKKMGWVDIQALKHKKLIRHRKHGDLQYPLHPLQTQPVTKPLNIVFLMIDSWRFDSFTKEVAPNIWKYAQQGRIFEHHLSTGNATRAGIFGLFYGIPSTYWQAFLANQRSPLLMDRLQQLGYDIQAFGSAQLTNPEFNQTVFRNIPHLRQHSDGNSPHERDEDVNHDWLQWFEHRDQSKPSFSFIFYDSPHGYDFPSDYPRLFKPILDPVDYLKLNNDFDPKPFMNRYKTSVHFTDSLAAKILDKLKNSGALRHTVVIISGDHGQEINDNKLNYWGHNSNFTQYQVHVPFIILAPDVTPGIETKLTSHEDVAPTLLQHYLGVTSPISDYSTGIDLLKPIKQRNWIISAKYSGYAIITDQSILEVSSSKGTYQLLDPTNRPITNKKPNFAQLQAAFEQIRRFNE